MSGDYKKQIHLKIDGRLVYTNPPGKEWVVNIRMVTLNKYIRATFGMYLQV
jgi:hypothetical protein